MKNNKWIKTVIAMLCIMTMMVTLVACGDNSGKDDTTQKGSETENQSETESQTENESQTDTENQLESETGSQIESEKESETESQTESEKENNKDSEESVYVEDSSKDEDSKNSESEKNESSNSEQITGSDNKNDNNTNNSNEADILGEGSASQPYLETPIVDGDGMTVTTVTIGAGKSVYYDIYRVGGMILKIQNANAYVEYNGKKYEAKNGVVSFAVENAMANAPINFKIGNKGNAATSFVIQFTNPTGSYMNPTRISSFSNSFALHVDAGNEVGHYYKYTAEKTGTITFYISKLTSSTKNAKAFISVTNNNTYANRTTDADGVKDGNYVKVSLDVSAGDEIMIQVGASPTATWKYPAEDIVWVAQYQ